MKMYMDSHLYHKNIYVKEKAAYERIYTLCYDFIKIVNCVCTGIIMKKYPERCKLKRYK